MKHALGIAFIVRERQKKVKKHKPRTEDAQKEVPTVAAAHQNPRTGSPQRKGRSRKKFQRPFGRQGGYRVKLKDYHDQLRDIEK